jgi:hypothetical protein
MILPVRIPCEGQRALGQYNCGATGEGPTPAKAKENAHDAARADAVKQMRLRKAPFCAEPPKGCLLTLEVTLGRGVVDAETTHVVYKLSNGTIIKEVYGWLYSGIAEVSGVCRKPEVKQPAGKKAPAKKKL